MMNHFLRAMVVVLGMAVPVLATPPEVRYRERTLSEWRELVKSVPASELADPDVVQGLMMIVADPAASWTDRKQFAMTLGRIGLPAAPAVPLFVELLQTPDAELGCDDPVSTRLWVIKALTLLGPAAQEARDEVRRYVLDERQPFLIRSSAMEALAMIAPGDGATLSVLVTILDNSPELLTEKRQEILELRRSAAEALGLLGQTAQPALPALIRALESDWPVLRRSAASAIGEIGPRADQAIDALVTMILLDSDDDPREAAADALGKIGTPAIPALNAILEDEETIVRLMAIRALSQMSSTDSQVLNTLRRALQDEVASVRGRAAEAILQREEDPIALQTLIAGLRESSRDPINVSYRVLKRHDQLLRPYRTTLEEIQNDPSLSSQSRNAAGRLLRILDE